MKIYFRITCLVLYLFSATLVLAEDDKENSSSNIPVVIAAAGTSYASGSSSALALLTLKGGSWVPESKDAGVNEGLYFQFKEPITVASISILAEPPELTEDYQLVAYINGMIFPVQQVLQDDGKILYKITDADDEAIEPLVKSVFIRLNGSRSSTKPLKVLAVKLLDSHEKLIPLKLPEAMIANSIKASSVLSPEFAYGPDHLFDSQFDIAWSTDGKKNKGINQSVTIELPEKRTINGLMIWNGYQRSKIHYRANGRVKKLDINGQLVIVKDSQIAQEILFPSPITSDKVTLTIKEIYKGDAYNDVLISELRFLTVSGDILLPLVQQQKIEFPTALNFMRDVSYSSIIDSVGFYDPDSESDSNDIVHKYDIGSLRLRSNGSFVIYKNQEDKTLFSASNTNVLEGNWEAVSNSSIRFFGKKYSVSSYDSYFSDYDYLRRRQKEQGEESSIKLPAPRIFQSTAVISKYNDLPERERKNILNYLLDSFKITPKMKARADANQEGKKFVIQTKICGDWDQKFFSADSKEQVRDQLYKRLLTINPIYIKSDVFTQLLVPQDEINICL